MPPLIVCRVKIWRRLFRANAASRTGIHNNIEAFGGNPDDVIAIGQSAGAISVGLHMTSYLGKQGVPFQKAV